MRMIILSRRIVQGNHEFVNNVRNNPHKKHTQDFIFENEKTRKKNKNKQKTIKPMFFSPMLTVSNRCRHC